MTLVSNSPLSYVALTNLGPFDIGEFTTPDDARDWAWQRYGADLLEVVPQPRSSVTVTTTPPTAAWILGAGLVALLLFGGTKKGKKAA